MNNKKLVKTLTGAAFSIAIVSIAAADEPALTTRPTTPPPDKSGYTLFNPAPVDQMRDMDTDRPNITNTPHTIDAGHVQIEAGMLDYTFTRYHASKTDNFIANDFAFGQANVRVGILNNLELNAVINAYESDHVHDYATNKSSYPGGFGDTSFGGKLNLWGDDGGDNVWSTALAIQPQLKFPTGRGGIGNGKFELSVAAPFLMNLPREFHLGLQPGVSYERNTTNSGYVTGFENTISIDRVVVGNLDVYVEYAADVTTQQHVKAPQTLDVGGTYPVSKNIVVDAGINFGLDYAVPNVEVLTGISLRF